MSWTRSPPRTSFEAPDEHPPIVRAALWPAEPFPALGLEVPESSSGQEYKRPGLERMIIEMTTPFCTAKLWPYPMSLEKRHRRAAHDYQCERCHQHPTHYPAAAVSGIKQSKRNSQLNLCGSLSNVSGCSKALWNTYLLSSLSNPLNNITSSFVMPGNQYHLCQGPYIARYRSKPETFSRINSSSPIVLPSHTARGNLRRGSSLTLRQAWITSSRDLLNSSTVTPSSCSCSSIPNVGVSSLSTPRERTNPSL
mmetsp:Transcript_156054/g.478920  ORF Transcript_156054/g.478920 Transcript_156054/m.478920 type:complete len:252 (-) Transcript_156054:391-1146(-)